LFYCFALTINNKLGFLEFATDAKQMMAQQTKKSGKWGTNSEDSIEQILLVFFKCKENNLTQSPQLQYASLCRCLQ